MWVDTPIMWSVKTNLRLSWSVPKRLLFEISFLNMLTNIVLKARFISFLLLVVFIVMNKSFTEIVFKADNFTSALSFPGNVHFIWIMA